MTYECEFGCGEVENPFHEHKLSPKEVKELRELLAFHKSMPYYGMLYSGVMSCGTSVFPDPNAEYYLGSGICIRCGSPERRDLHVCPLKEGPIC